MFRAIIFYLLVLVLIYFGVHLLLYQLLAVLVALFYPIYQNRSQRKLEIHQSINYDFENGLVRLVVTIDNIGNRNILINSMGFMTENKINITQNKLLKFQKCALLLL